MILFTLATLGPTALLMLAAMFGGAWTLAALLSLTCAVALLDRVFAGPAPVTGSPNAMLLPIILGLGHFMVLWLVIDTLSQKGMPLSDSALFLTAALYFGQISNANGHELIHQRKRLPRALGVWVYISLLFGHHASAHTLVHHVHVATPDDPNTARLGENYYTYMVRAWRRSFMQGYRAETARLQRSGRPSWRHPYLTYVGGSCLVSAAVFIPYGLIGLLWFAALAAAAQQQLLLSDFVQHYGLRRRHTQQGPYEPVGPLHSWNSPHRFSSAMMLNAPRHSDHHSHPAEPFHSLRLPNDVPMLPSSLPIMICLALFPRLWRRVMDPLVAKWQVRCVPNT